MELGEENEELDPSNLGTKQYWNHVYDNEFNNFIDHGDIGEIWFGEESIIRIINWMKSNYNSSKENSIVDLGCGNGMMLIELARGGYQNLVGLDYSEKAVDLASSIVSKQDMNSIITLKVCDLVIDEFTESFSVALDKGTYDAISLNPDNTKEKRLTYIKKVHKLLKPDGLFIITSCNWTDKEIIAHFQQYFTLHAVIGTPEFKFGGKIGKLLSSLVLQRIN